MQDGDIISNTETKKKWIRQVNEREKEEMGTLRIRISLSRRREALTMSSVVMEAS